MQKILSALRICGGIAIFIGWTSNARAQWQIQPSGTNASLRGIHAVNSTTAWASGTHGTVLRTTDGGHHWQVCRVPSGAEKLDFRSVWAWDAKDAMVMSSGPGADSKLYSTHDGCRTWRLVFANPDANGFWDGLQFDGKRFGVILGDPTQGNFTLFATYDSGLHWTGQSSECLHTMERQQGAFAASNQSLVVLPLKAKNPQEGFGVNHQIWFGTSGGWLYGLQLIPLQMIADAPVEGCTRSRILAGKGNTSAGEGIFAIAFHDGLHAVAVGGDYTKPHSSVATAAYTLDGSHWHPATTGPLGYRSTVAWDVSNGSWVAAGPSGSDISIDSGKTWQALDRGNWNALSLPFAVGPDGRIGRLESWGQLRAMTSKPAPAQPYSPTGSQIAGRNRKGQ